jgi:ABC-type transport system involved in multi-copper enzyme maturation permease subunit
MTTTLNVFSLPTGRQRLSHVIRGEVTKLPTVRSTLVTIGVTIVGALLVTGLAANHSAGQSPMNFRNSGFDSTNMTLTGLFVASLAIGVLGVLAVSGEYGSGTIRSSLSATPRRGDFFAAKVIVVGLLALALGELLSFGCFFLGQGIIAGSAAPTASLGQADVLRAVLLSGAFLSLLALFAVGLGFIIRHTAGAIATYVGFTLLLTLILQPLGNHVVRFAPDNIYANSVSDTVTQGGALSAYWGFAIMAVYTAVTLAVGAALLARRDA